MNLLETVANLVSDLDTEALPVSAAQTVLAYCAEQWQSADLAENSEEVDLRHALGRILALDVLCPIDVPAHDNCAMDGYAFNGAVLGSGSKTRLADRADNANVAEITLRVIGRALAGQPFEGTVQAGESVRVTTGAVLPNDCDTVIPQEYVTTVADLVTASAIPSDPASHSASHSASAAPAEAAASDNGPAQFSSAGLVTLIRFPVNALVAGANRRRAGEDLRHGATALQKGRVVTASDLGLLASLGLSHVAVRRRLRVAFFSTGNELRSVGEPLVPGAVYDSNRYTLYGMLQRLGVEILDLGIVRDDAPAIEAAFCMAAARADAVITSGGVSVGEADLTRSMMDQLGEVTFWKLAMRPGRPFAFGRLWPGANPGKASRPDTGERSGTGQPALLFGLPGNPVAVMVGFYLLVRPALLLMMGARTAAPPMVRAICATRIAKRAGRTEYLRAVSRREADGVWHVELTGAQGSGVLSSMSDANCFVLLHHDTADVPAGGEVDLILFDGLI